MGVSYPTYFAGTVGAGRDQRVYVTIAKFIAIGDGEVADAAVDCTPSFPVRNGPTVGLAYPARKR